MIRFTAAPYTIGSWTVLRLPEKASKELPSRGQVMVKGTINGVDFQTPLEPDGNWSHWFRLDKALQKSTNAKAGQPAELAIEPTKEWPEPEVPADLKAAIQADRAARDLWPRITPMARWEWIRWTRSTGNAETRAHRVKVAISKMNAGERRPCCWNRNLCTEPSVSKSGVLLGPS